MHYTTQYICDLRESVEAVQGLEKIRGASILITGASGLIGSGLADLLLCAKRDYGFDVDVILAGRNLDVLKNRFSYWGDLVTYVTYDATASISFDIDFRYVIHCASNAHPAAYSHYPVETILTNILGTNNLLRYCVDKSVERFLYVSSSEVYGEKSSDSFYTEDIYFSVDSLNPRSCYPNSKRVCETLCASYLREHNLDYVVARPGHIYGPTMQGSDTRAASDFARRAKSGDSIIMKSPGLQKRSYCYVADCSSAILSILLNGESGEAYNISNSNSICTIKDLAQAFAEIGNVDLHFEIPSEIEKAGYNMMSNSALDSSKLESLGWSGRFDLRRGVYATLDAC